MNHSWVFLVYSDLTHFSFIMPKLHLPWFCLFTHLESLHCWHLMLVSGFASNLSMFHYFSTGFLCLCSDIFSLKCCLFLLQCTSFSGYLETQLKKNCQPYCLKSSRSFSNFCFLLFILCLSEVHYNALWEFAFAYWVKNNAKLCYVNDSYAHFVSKQRIAERPRKL